MRQVAVSPCLAGDPVQLKEEFVRWLERVSLKVEGGVTIVIDSADRLQVRLIISLSFVDRKESLKISRI